MGGGTVYFWPYYSSMSSPFLEFPLWSFSPYSLSWIVPVSECLFPASLSRACWMPSSQGCWAWPPVDNTACVFLHCIFLLEPKFPENRNFQRVFSRALPTMPSSQWSVSITDNVNVDRVTQYLENKSLTWQSNWKSNNSYSEGHDHSIATVKLSRRLRGDNSETFFLEYFIWRV